MFLFLSVSFFQFRPCVCSQIENQGSKSPVGSRKKQSASPSRSSSRSSSWGRRRRESKQSHDKKSSTPRDGYRHYNRARFERYNSRDRMLKRRASRSSSSRSRSRSRSPRLRPARRGTSPRCLYYCRELSIVRSFVVSRLTSLICSRTCNAHLYLRCFAVFR